MNPINEIFRRRSHFHRYNQFGSWSVLHHINIEFGVRFVENGFGC